MIEKIRERQAKITNDETQLLNIVIIVSHITGVTSEEMKSRNQTRRICEARKTVMKIAYDTGRFSEQFLGKYFNRHHSTVDHARKSVSDLYDTDKYFKNKVENIRALIRDKNISTHNWEVFKASQNEE